MISNLNILTGCCEMILCMFVCVCVRININEEMGLWLHKFTKRPNPNSNWWNERDDEGKSRTHINSLDLGIWPPFRTTGQEKTLHRLGTFLTFTWTLFFLCISWCQCYYAVVPVDMRMQENAKMSNLINGIKDLYWRIVSSPDWEALSTLTFQLYVFVFFSHGFGNANP